MKRLEGKVALVTGGAQGMGAAIAGLFAAEGCEVVIGDIQNDKGETTAAEIGANAHFVALDVTDPAQWDRAVTAARDRFGRIDILINNAGGASHVSLLEEETPEAHRRVVELNLTGVWSGMRAVLPVMKRQGGGAIVNISSIDGLVGVRGMTSYAGAKFAVTGMTRSVALEVGRHGIRVNSVHPGIIATPLVAAAPPDVVRSLETVVDRQPIARMGRPEEIARAVLFFASDESSYCTGASLVVDGGHIAGPYRVPLES